MDTEHAAHFVLQVAVIILAANLMGRFFQRVLKQPSVLGELVAGMLIGPYALGGIALFGMERGLFAWVGQGTPAVSNELYALAVLASAVLLFLAGLETDVEKFLRYSVAGLVTGLGGAVLSFALGDAVVVWAGYAESYSDPTALFMGTVATATSVGLTARVLSEKRKMDTAEGATILSGAVIDDVIGLICLAVVLGLVARGGTGAQGIDWAHVGWVVAKALLFWVGTLAVGILFARQIGRFLKIFGPQRAVAIGALALAFLLAALAEMVGLALIIGAYTMGLSLSRLDAVHEIQDRLAPVYALLVPIFFCVTGMMVDLGTFLHFLPLGLMFAAVAVAGKVIGCGAPAFLLGFNARGALRVGLGMMPRQEVALIVAGVGLSAGVLGAGHFGAVVVLTLVTALAAPALLGWVFDDRPGLRRPEKVPPRASEEFRLTLPAPEVASLVAARMADAFRQEEFFTHYRAELNSYEFRKQAVTVFMQRDQATLVFSTAPDALDYARLIATEEMVELRDIFQKASETDPDADLRRLLLGEPT